MRFFNFLRKFRFFQRDGLVIANATPYDVTNRIIPQVEEGIEAGAFSGNKQGVKNLEQELISICHHRKKEVTGQYLYIFADEKINKYIGFAYLKPVISEYDQLACLELNMFSVVSHQRGKGYGKRMLEYLLNRSGAVDLEAVCLPQSMQMMNLLENYGFQLVQTTAGGKRTWRLPAK
ncbi:GNAT family N-acetyltransferase [Erwinia mallotivora]|uniref:GNAT family N-acetyltransferase n=1 Tax=Erwinia mallotivora TaxID=69222 RepID=UPI0035E8FCDC